MSFNDILELDKKVERFERLFKDLTYTVDVIRSGNPFLVICDKNHLNEMTLEEHLKVGGCLTCKAEKAQLNRRHRNRSETYHALAENFDVTMTQVMVVDTDHVPFLIHCKKGHELLTTIRDIDEECTDIVNNEITVSQLECDKCQEEDESQRLMVRMRSAVIKLGFIEDIRSNETTVTEDTLVKVSCSFGHAETLTVNELLSLKSCPTCDALEVTRKHEIRQHVVAELGDKVEVIQHCAHGHLTTMGYCGICADDDEIDAYTLLPHLHSITGYHYESVTEVINVNETLNVICQQHGTFETTASSTLSGFGVCPYCNWSSLLDTVTVMVTEHNDIKVLIGFDEGELDEGYTNYTVVFRKTYKHAGKAKRTYDTIVIALTNAVNVEPVLTEVSATLAVVIIPDCLSTIGIANLIRQYEENLTQINNSISLIDGPRVNIPYELTTPSF